MTSGPGTARTVLRGLAALAVGVAMLTAVAMACAAPPVPDVAGAEAQARLKQQEIQLNYALNRPGATPEERRQTLRELARLHEAMDRLTQGKTTGGGDGAPSERWAAAGDWFKRYRLPLSAGLIALLLAGLARRLARMGGATVVRVETLPSPSVAADPVAESPETAPAEPPANKAPAKPSRPSASAPTAGRRENFPVLLQDIQAEVDKRFMSGGEQAAREATDFLLRQAVAWQASDIHLQPGDRAGQALFRIDGVLHLVAEFSMERHRQTVNVVKVLARLRHYETRAAQDGRLSLTHDGREVEFRVATIPVLEGERVILRIVGNAIGAFDIDGLGLSAGTLKTLKTNLQRRNGVILMVGPVGSGKTTTLYSSLNWIRKHHPGTAIATLEDPIEHALGGVAQVQINPAKGLTYEHGFVNLLRQDAQVILISEIRNIEMARLVMQAGQTAQLVFSTIHSASTEGALERLLDMGVEDYVLFNAVRAVQAQRLVPAVCRQCAEPYEPPRSLLLRAKEILGAAEADWRRGKGCDACGGSGVLGRAVIDEMLPLEDVGALTSTRDRGERHRLLRGMKTHTLWQDGVAKAARGWTTLEAVEEATAV